MEHGLLSKFFLNKHSLPRYIFHDNSVFNNRTLSCLHLCDRTNKVDYVNFVNLYQIPLKQRSNFHKTVYISIRIQTHVTDHYTDILIHCTSVNIFPSAIHMRVHYTSLLYRHECFTGKYTTRKIHKNYIRDLSLSMISLISSLFLKLYFNSLVYRRNIFGCCSKVFGNLRKVSENVRDRSSGLRNNIGKSSEGGRKSSEKHQKRVHQHVYITSNSSHYSCPRFFYS